MNEDKYDGMWKAMTWYRSNRKTMDASMLEKLMSARATIATDSVEYAKEYAEQSEIHNNNHWKRTSLVDEEAVRLQSETDPATGKTYSDAKSSRMGLIKEDAKKAYSLEYQSKGKIMGMDKVLKQINAVLESMKQDIAEFRAIRSDNDKTKGDSR